MQYTKHLIIQLFLIAFSLSCYAQLPGSIDKLSASKLKAYGKAAFEAGDMYSAADYYEAYCNKKDKDFKTAYLLAEALRASRHYAKAETWYLTAYEGDPEGNVMGLFYHAQMQKMNGKYDEAKANFAKFRKKYGKNHDDVKDIRRMVRIEVEGCEMSHRLIDTIPLNVDIAHLPINKAHIEFSPMPLNDSTLIYAALKMDESKFFSTKDSAKLPVRQFYLAQKNGDTWADVGELEGPFNQPNTHTGNGAYSPDGERFYFTRCGKNWQGKVLCAIYVSDLVENEWQTPRKLGPNINDDNYTSTQPTIAIETFRNREVMYFISDRPGGKGGLDIWFSIFDAKKSEFKEAKCLSIKVNSKADEMSPYYDQGSQTLYYSSNGRAGLGGFDIFKATGELFKWQPGENVGYPINSSADDLYYVLHEDGESGYLVSNRPGGVALVNPTCCDDIYAFEMLPEPPPPSIPPKTDSIVVVEKPPVKPPPVYIKGNLCEKSTGNTIRNMVGGGLVSLYKIDGGNRSFVRSAITDREGKFSFKAEHDSDYEVKLSKENYFNKSVRVNTRNVPDNIVLISDCIERITEKAIVIQNIYYEFDKDELTSTATQTISEVLYPLLLENPSLIVQIRSHTDSKGKDSYNMDLSQRRAESVVRYLIQKGIDSQRLQAKGFGETSPIAQNTNADGSDNPDGRQKNRRTEFKVVGKLDISIQYRE